VAALLLLTILEFGSAQAAEVRCASDGRYLSERQIRAAIAQRGIGQLDESLSQKEEFSSSQKEQFARRWPSGVLPIVGRTCMTGVILGPIENGDYEKVRAFYRLNHPFLETFDLASAGGNVVEAIKIGRLFRKYLISAHAPFRGSLPSGREYFYGLGHEKECGALADKCTCASACALIWFGAVDRVGSVGLHRPRTTDPYFRALDPSDGATTYRKALDGIQAYLDDMEVAKPVIELMTATGSADIKWVTAHKDGLERPPSLAEWEDATCGSFSTDDDKLLAALGAKGGDKLLAALGAALGEKGAGLTHQEQSRYDQLQKKQNERRTCQMFLLSGHRDKLPPP
jgi:hypothetical protein